MKEETQRIAIAEALGIEDVRWKLANGYLPDYLNDLNAMHAAENACFLAKGAHRYRWEEYDNHLFNLCGGFARAHATAAQRAEAFLRTIGKWQDSPHP